MTKRPYRSSKRAAQQAETRQKIVEAAVALHGEVGARDASIKAIAERAGVERLTVYRHFPDQAELLSACTGKWLEDNPFPQFAEASACDGERLRDTLLALYAYYAGTAPMWRLSWRDRGDVPALDARMQEVDARLDALALKLLGGAGLERWQATTLCHALDFRTWDLLEGQGLADADKALLVLHWLGLASTP